MRKKRKQIAVPTWRGGLLSKTYSISYEGIIALRARRPSDEYEAT